MIGAMDFGQGGRGQAHCLNGTGEILGREGRQTNAQWLMQGNTQLVNTEKGQNTKRSSALPPGNRDS